MGMDGGIGGENDHNSLYKCMKPANNKRMGGDWLWMILLAFFSSQISSNVCHMCMYVHIYMHVCKFSRYGYPLPPPYLPLLLEKIYQVGIPVKDTMPSFFREFKDHNQQVSLTMWFPFLWLWFYSWFEEASCAKAEWDFRLVKLWSCSGQLLAVFSMVGLFCLLLFLVVSYFIVFQNRSDSFW